MSKAPKVTFFNAEGVDALPPWRPKHRFLFTPPVAMYEFLLRFPTAIIAPRRRTGGPPHALLFSTREQLVYGLAVYDLDADAVDAAFRAAGLPYRHDVT